MTTVQTTTVLCSQTLRSTFGSRNLARARSPWGWDPTFWIYHSCSLPRFNPPPRCAAEEKGTGLYCLGNPQLLVPFQSLGQYPCFFGSCHFFSFTRWRPIVVFLLNSQHNALFKIKPWEESYLQGIWHQSPPRGEGTQPCLPPLNQERGTTQVQMSVAIGTLCNIWHLSYLIWWWY